MLFHSALDKEYMFELNDHVILNKESDSWRELPVLKEDKTEMLPGKVKVN